MTFKELFIQINIDLQAKYGEFYNILFSNYLLTKNATIRYDLSVYDLQQIVEFYFNTYLFEIKLYNALYEQIEQFIDPNNFKETNTITSLNEVLIGVIKTSYNENKEISESGSNNNNDSSTSYVGMTSNNLNNFSNVDKTEGNGFSTNVNSQTILSNELDNFNTQTSSGNKIQDTETATSGNIGKIYFD